MVKAYPQIGVQIPDILLPKEPINPQKWAVIACDQFTSQPEYWQKVEAFVGDSPSTLHLILPEVYLGKQDEDVRLKQVLASMKEYLNADIFSHHQELILVEREVDGKTRHGLIMALDLEMYDFKPGSASLIRATEGTILDRLPPRIKIRQQALIEAPHILVLIDDAQGTVIEPLAARKGSLNKCYDFDLMQSSGHMRGYQINQPELESQVFAALSKLSEAETFKSKYDLKEDKPVLLFAVGDGNHSLATAKSVWEKLKPSVGMDHPARYALVEIENVHDAGLEFEPIHRVLFNVKKDIKTDLNKYFEGRISFEPFKDKKALLAKIALSNPDNHYLGLVYPQGCELLTIQKPTANLAVGTLQPFLDSWVKEGNAEQIDYVHGDHVVFDLGSRPGNVGFLLPTLSKQDLFKTVILDGSLPRKTFSMGEAHEKRFYMECRTITR
ncbi:MAG: DUF1015 domain-containing protein [Anaerolineae bacterium]|nr:DUF1015 domain-containing protein [Anaerolineae bacterium]